MARILAFAGSTREGSFNRKLIRIAARGAKNAGADVTLVELVDYPMPLFNQDLEVNEGMPKAAHELKQLFIEHDGLLIASPEYNSAFTPLMKNTLDWVSRRETDDEPPLAAYQGKVAAIMSASPGRLGGIRGLVFLRMLLANLGIVVLPEQQAIPQAMQAFNEDGSLIDSLQQEAVLNLGINLSNMLAKLKQ